jgi:hypothetical protein
MRNPKVIGVIALSASAALLLTANLLMSPAKADSVWTNRDYTAVTAHLATGDDALYVTDNFSGQIAVFGYDATARSVRLKTPPAALPAIFGNAR